MMPEDQNKALENINQRLNILIYLELRRHEIEEMNIGQQIFLLKRFGLDDGEIANLFGKTKSYISGVIVKQRKGSD